MQHDQHQPRALLLTQFFPPETGAPANRTGSLAAALVRKFKLTVITLKPSYPAPQHYRQIEYQELDAQRDYRIRRAMHFTPHAGGFLLRGCREVAMAGVLGSLASLAKMDLVVASSPSMFLGPVALAVARTRSARFVWDLRDITWGYAADLGGPSGMGLVTRSLAGVMNGIARRADLVSVTNAGSVEALKAVGVAGERLTIVPNGVSEDVLLRMRALGVPPQRSRLRVVYVGLLGHNQGLSTLLRVAERATDTDFHLVGDGPEASMLRALARERRLPNVFFSDFIVDGQVAEAYEAADVLFVQLRDSPTLNATAVPSKLFEYMSTGRPILYAGSGVAADLVQVAGVGIVVKSDDIDAIRGALDRLRASPEARRELGQAGLAYVRMHGLRERIMEEFVDDLTQLEWARPVR